MNIIQDFQVGDRVVVVEGINENIKAGMNGTIISVDYDSPPIGIDFGKQINGHDCHKKCASGQGWYVERENISLVEMDDKGNEHHSLHKTKWVELMQRTSERDGNYIYIREPWLINGQAVSILPYRKIKSGYAEFLLRYEMADVPVSGTIKGGCDKEGEEIVETAVRELLEEAGYSTYPSHMISLGTARTSKLNTTTMNLFAVDVTDMIQEEAVGDGTMNEANAYCKWVSEEELWDCQDPIVHTTLIRLFNK